VQEVLPIDQEHRAEEPLSLRLDQPANRVERFVQPSIFIDHLQNALLAI
jgi:hypothetical protein